MLRIVAQRKPPDEEQQADTACICSRGTNGEVTAMPETEDDDASSWCKRCAGARAPISRVSTPLLEQGRVRVQQVPDALTNAACYGRTDTIALDAARVSRAAATYRR